ncbi:hypothetical protein [Pararobbsia silviterrae]|uniref:Uncharacterized protein n=1 Tax=Pararobbsia silviterrae TaxID=1792498 RepID=A0A494YBC9_9BURK|nr:hypothetical protein [Pararobbsia silviterrae]RKP59060.1 hypothetical protein D7S86_03870 [Pararobbsia silviterrae]
MKTTIRNEAARLWYALKIAAGQNPAAPSKAAKRAARPLRARHPALVALARAGRKSVQAEHRRVAQADGRRPAYALPYSPSPSPRALARPVEPRAVASARVDGDADVVM